MRKSSFIIDKLTNSIEDAISGESFETEVIEVTRTDLKKILKKNGWLFNWKNESKFEQRKLYKLVINESDDIQGLISIEIKDKFVELHLIETAPSNFGKSKKYLGVAGNLIAFACKTSFEHDFDGYISFTAKTDLIPHYISTLGATLIFKNRMSIDTRSAKKLVNSYYKNHFNEQ